MQKRWLFHATDFQTLMYPCFTMGRILGTFPYKINNSIFVASKPYYILSTTITSALCVLGLGKYYDFNIFTKVKFEVVTMSLEFNCYIMLIDSMIIITLVLSSQRMRLLQTIMEISVRLSPQSYQKLSRLIHAKDIFGFLYFIGFSSIYFYKRRIEILHIIFVVHSVLFAFQMDMLYINCVCILKACFKEIDNNLLRMKELVVNDELRVPKTIYYEQKNPFLIMKLKALKKQHLMISNTIQMLNVIFSLQLLVTITLSFFGVVFELYFHLVKWHNGLVINNNEDAYILSLTPMMCQIIKMALIVWACETGKNQARDIGTTIHDVLNNTIDEQIKDEVIKVI